MRTSLGTGTELDRDALSKLRTARIGRSLLVLDTCSSTNDVAAREAEDGAPDGFVVIANEQTMGRGRHARKWVSPKGGIWMTLVLRPPIRSETLCGLTQLGALSIAMSVSQDVRTKAWVRWPNDVVTRYGKLGGVLAETRTAGNEVLFALLGMGVNANFHSFELGEVNQPASTLLEEIGTPISRATLIASILTELEHLLDQMHVQGMEQVVKLLRKSEVSIGRRVLVELEGQPRLEGSIDDYESLTCIRILSTSGKIERIEASSVISITYLD